MADVLNFGVEPISCHAWNGDRTHVAVSHNNNEVCIYRVNGTRHDLVTTLSEHAQRVTGIDWAARSNKIVTCSADRNAYVWIQQADRSWTPTLVILRINRAATYVKWSPHENKFAVASGARLISVCYFEEENDWWVSKHIKKPIRSTVTSVDWHPNNVLLACGSTDFKARVFSAYIKEVDAKPEATSWGKKMTFGNVMNEFSNGGGGWVHDVSFSEDGECLAWVGHDSSVSVVKATTEQGPSAGIATTKTQTLPFMSCVWVNPTTIVVAGHDCCPMVFNFDGQTVNFAGKVEEGKNKAAGAKFSALKHFRALDTHATTAENNVTDLDTIHQNAVTQVSIHKGNKAACQSYSTSGVDGKVVVWKASSLEGAMRGVKI